MVVAEAPTYPGAVPVFVSYQADVVQVEMDDHGMRIDVLLAELDRLDREGRVPKFIYTVPSFQNPAGVTLSLERRRELVRIAHERELLVLEDNPYGLLRYEGESLPTLYSLDRGAYVIYLGTFSKILSPGLRLGWTAAPAPVLDKLNLGKGGVDLCSATLSQQFVATYFAERDWRAYVRTQVDLYRRRRDVMLEALAEYMPREATWTEPNGGLFIWARMPDYIDTTDLLARALRENVAFVPGRAAYLDGRGGSEMRLNFSGITEDDIREGVRRIGKIVREQVALYSTLTGEQPAAAAGGRAAQRGRVPPPGELTTSLQAVWQPAPRRHRSHPAAVPDRATDCRYWSPLKSSGVTWSRNSLNLSTTSSVSSTSCSNSIADSAITSSAAKIGAPERTASASASDGRESMSTSRPFTLSVIEA